MTTATPPAPYSTLEGALASGFAITQLHHSPGHDREILPSSAASSFLLNGRALEALPYHLVKEMEDIGMDLEIAAWHDKEEFSPNIGPVISRAEEWLAKVPR